MHESSGPTSEGKAETEGWGYTGVDPTLVLCGARAANIATSNGRLNFDSTAPKTAATIATSNLTSGCQQGLWSIGLGVLLSSFMVASTLSSVGLRHGNGGGRERRGGRWKNALIDKGEVFKNVQVASLWSRKTQSFLHASTSKKSLRFSFYVPILSCGRKHRRYEG